MHSRLSLSTLALTLLLTSSALSQDATPGADDLPDATTGTQPDTSVQTTTGEATSALPTQINADAVLAAIAASGDMAEQIGAVASVATLNVVRLDDVPGGQASLTSALQANEAGSSKLRTAIQANAAISGKLAESGAEAEAIVAARIEADGAVTVFVK